MTEKEVLLTQDGFDKLEAELNLLRTVKRKEVAEKIKVARGFGDLSENAEYDEAKLEQAQIEERIVKIESMLSNATIIEEDSNSEEVRVGSKVKVKNLTMNTEKEYTIVGSAEADPLHGKISNVSPIGSAVLGAKLGEVVKTITPSGVLELEIIDIVS